MWFDAEGGRGGSEAGAGFPSLPAGPIQNAKGASAAHALFTQRGTIHLTPYGPKTESEQSSRVTLVGVTLAVGKGSLAENGRAGAHPLS